MGVNVRRLGKEKFRVDVLYRLPDGSRKRNRCRVRLSSQSAAQRWGEARERHLLIHGPDRPRKKEVQTFQQFVPRCLDDARANRQKPSTIAAKQNILDVHLIPQLGPKRLDAINNSDIQVLKGRLQDRAPKTVNNILVVLSWVLRTAEKLGIIDRMPCAISLLPNPKTEVRFYDFEQYERLLVELEAESHQAFVVGLLGGEGGLRRGEMAALEWGDVDVDQQQICVQRSVWNGHVTAPKGGRLRYVPMTARLAEALRKHRHLGSRRVLCTPAGEALTPKMVADYVRRAARRAQLAETGAHILRHAFCSHLAMLGAPARVIQELAGHQDIRTTQGYMHLSPAERAAAIRLLNRPSSRGTQSGTPDQAQQEVQQKEEVGWGG